jgi:hypothetical protein
VAHEDDGVDPNVAGDVRGEVRGERPLPGATGQRREHDCVLGDLLRGLAQEALDLVAGASLGFAAVANGVELHVVERDAPLEGERHQHAVHGLEQVDGVPGLRCVDAHRRVAEVAVLTEDVRVLMVLEVV